MAKLALLIGVSDYESGLNPLPGAVKDIEAMQRVLQHKDMGGFDRVDILPNPEPQKMQEAIETLFSDRSKEDLALLFFSGHGVKDDSGRLYFATRATRKTPKGELVKSTAVPAGFVHDIMENSRCKRQLIILDCCFSGAFAEGMTAKDDGTVDVQTQLGGEGRAVLTSSTSTQYSFEQQGSDLSVYTRYLVEGIETGAADRDGDGMISIDELHEYTQKKVQEAAPAMKPKIYAVEEGFKIRLAQAPTDDPQLSYRKEVERFASRGEISDIGRFTLDAYQETLALPKEVAQTIEAEVLKPYQERQRKLQRYEQVLQQAIARETSLSDATCEELKRLQKVLGLRDEDVDPLMARMPQQPNPVIQGFVSGLETTGLKATGLETTGESSALNQDSIKTPQAKPSSDLLAIGRKNTKLFVLAGGALAAVFLVVLQPHSQPGSSPTPPESSPAATATPLTSQATSSQMTAEDFFNRGLDESKNGNHRGAVDNYTQAIKLKPYYAAAYYARGNARRDLGDKQGAIDDYTQAIQVNQNWVTFTSGYYGLPTAYYSRGNARGDLGDNAGAIKDYDQAIRLKSDYADAYYGRGGRYTALSNKQAASQDYQKAASLYQQQGDTAWYQKALNQVKTLQQK